MNARKSPKKPPAVKPAKAKGTAKRTECPSPPAWEADEAETPAARVLAAVAKIEAANGNPPPPACIPVDPSPVAGGVYAGDFLFAARGILAADGFDLEAVKAAERSFREVAAGRLCLSGKVAAAAAALEIFTGRVATPQGWRNTTERPAPLDELAVRWEVLRWNLLEAVAALYRECAEAERASVARSAIERAVRRVRPIERAIKTGGTVSPLLDPLRLDERVNLTGFLSPDWVRFGELVGLATLSTDAWSVLNGFYYVLEEVWKLHALFRAEIYAGDTDAPGEYQATDALREIAAKIEAEGRATREAVHADGKATREAVHADGEATRATIAKTSGGRGRGRILQKDVAAALGVSVRVVWNWEHGRGNPPFGYTKELRLSWDEVGFHSWLETVRQNVKIFERLKAVPGVRLGNRGRGPGLGRQFDEIERPEC